MTFNPNFTITDNIKRALAEIESLKKDIRRLPISTTLLETLRENAKLQSVYSLTSIEKNGLSRNELNKVIIDNRKIIGKEEEGNRIKSYYLALTCIGRDGKNIIDESIIMIIHSLVVSEGKKSVKLIKYRDNQNFIADSLTDKTVYIPPKAEDIPILMKEFVEYINNNEYVIPTPILAAIVHYQFVTIRPYRDGNGRTAKLLTNLILYRRDYDFNSIYSLEEYYAKNLDEYYNAMTVGGHHNYYFGRAEADISGWIEYFVLGMLDSIRKIKKYITDKLHADDSRYNNDIFRSLTPQEKLMLTLFENTDIITTNDVAKLFNFTQRSARNLVNKLVNKDILRVVDTSNRNRCYGLGERFSEIK